MVSFRIPGFLPIPPPPPPPPEMPIIQFDSGWEYLIAFIILVIVVIALLMIVKWCFTALKDTLVYIISFVIMYCICEAVKLMVFSESISKIQSIFKLCWDNADSLYSIFYDSMISKTK